MSITADDSRHDRLAMVSPGEQEGTETVLDRIVYIERELITEVPEVPRWCDRLGLQGHRVDIGDAELFVEEEGQGPPLVLISGGPGGTHHSFHPWFSQAARFCRVMYYDQRGCGLSDHSPGDEGYSARQAVLDLEALRRALGIERWIVLGHSYGGILAQIYTLDYPEHVAGLVLVASSLGFPTNIQPRFVEHLSEEEIQRMNEIDREVQQLAGSRSWQECRVLQRYNTMVNGEWKLRHLHKPSPEQMAAIARYDWDSDENVYAQVYRSLAGLDLGGRFNSSTIPTLILEGRQDMVWHAGKTELIAANHPHARMVSFEHAGHTLYTDEPERVFSVLGDFVSGLSEA